MGIQKSILLSIFLFLGVSQKSFALDYPDYSIKRVNKDCSQLSCGYGDGFWSTEKNKCDCPKRPENYNYEGAVTAGSEGCFSAVLRLTNLKMKCQEEQANTAQNCDSKNNQDMNSVSNQASQLAVAMGSQTAGIASACSAMGTLMGTANGAIAAYRLVCSTAISSCRSACGELASLAESQASCFADDQSIAETRNLANGCSQYDAKVQEASTALQNVIATASNAKQCAALTAGSSLAICSSYPSLPGCSAATAVDCSDPTAAASNTVCICSANPTATACISGLAAAGLNPVVSGSGDNSSRLLNQASAGSVSLGDIPDTPMIAQGTANKSGSGSGQVDGKMGGSAAGGGGSGGSGGSPGGAGGRDSASGDEAGIASGGFYGGGGSGGYRGGSASREAASTGSGGGYGGTAAAAGGPDLRKFLPGGQFDPRRSISGASGPDGITGPNSSIWQKIQNRYQATTPTLLP